jgi:hypothetical protein
MKPYRTLLLVIGCLLYANAPARAQSLLLERRGDHLHIAAPQLHFLSESATQKLRNGSTVTYVLTLTVAQEHSRKPVFFLQKRFVVSFDLWEEKYSVVQRGLENHSASRMNTAAAEAWCFENMPIPVSFVLERQPFMVRLECSMDSGEEKEAGENHSSLTLAGLIDIFSRKRQEEPSRWEAIAGPLRLEELKDLR